MRGLFLIGVFTLMTTCDAAGPGFRGVEKIERSVEGSDFMLRRRGALVEAIRVSFEPLPHFEPVARKAAYLAEQETGCKAAWIEGDPSMMLIGLRCGGAKAPKKPKRQQTLACDIRDLQEIAGVVRGELDCLKQ